MKNKKIQVPQGKTLLSFGEGLGVRLLLLTSVFYSLLSISGYSQTSSIPNLPVISGEINGSQNVCLYVPTTYTLNENDPDFIYVWKAEGGKVIGNNTGKKATVVFTSSTGKISVVKQRFVEGEFLRSEPKTLQVQQMDLSPKIINSSNAEVFYTSSVYTFSLDLGGVVPDHIQWHIVGNGAYKNFGNIINGIYDTDVTVSFNEVSRSFNGAVVAEITKCGVTTVAAFEIKLQGKPLPNIKHKECEYENAPDPRFYLDQMALAAQMFDHIIIRQERHLRGRTAKEIVDLLIEGMKQVKSDLSYEIISKETEAIQHAILMAEDNDFIIALSDVVSNAIEIVEKYRNTEFFTPIQQQISK